MVTDYYKCVKGIVHPKMKILSLITHRHVFPNPQDLRSSSEHKLTYFWWNPRAFWPCIDSNTTTRKVVRTLFKIVHVIKRYFMMLQEYVLCTKKTKIMTTSLPYQSSTCVHNSTTIHVLLTQEPPFWRRTSISLSSSVYSGSNSKKSSDRFMKTV